MVCSRVEMERLRSEEDVDVATRVPSRFRMRWFPKKLGFMIALGATLGTVGATPISAPASVEARIESSRPEATDEEILYVDQLEQLVQQRPEWGRDFYFTRAIYTSGWRRGSWAVDFPKADRQFLFVLQRLLTLLDAHGSENPVALDDPELRRYPFLYMLEIGGMSLNPAEIEGLRGYLEAGGFLVVDDFWGTRAFENLRYQMSLVLPDRKIREIPMDHPIFHQFYDIDEVLTVPNLGSGMRGPPYEECRGCLPQIFGIFDDHDELMVVINWNTDLGDAWEWSENPYYPIDRSNYAYELAINYIIYALSH